MALLQFLFANFITVCCYRNSYQSYQCGFVTDAPVVTNPADETVATPNVPNIVDVTVGGLGVRNAANIVGAGPSGITAMVGVAVVVAPYSQSSSSCPSGCC